MRTFLLAILLTMTIAAIAAWAAMPSGVLSIGGTPAEGLLRNEEPPAGGAIEARLPSDAEAGATGASMSGCGGSALPGDALNVLESSGGLRGYRIHVPESYRPDRPESLVLNFHGYGRGAAEQEAYSGLVPLADSEGFILVTPEGSGAPPGWDIVGIYADIGVDDVQFTAELVAAIGSTWCIDSSRVYATGFSNGAEMASQVACRLPDVFAAVAPIAGAVYQGCDGGPVPVIAFQGTADENVLYDWSLEGIRRWAAHNGCAAEVETERLGDSVVSEAYAGCNGNDVVFVVIDGGGHTWPGAVDGAGGVGATTHEISASELLWRFFASHPKWNR